ncbi:MAG: 4Fe-4S binding protein [Lachnospiraceae bacterium]|nr:4Fe-4S binding protein [Lachnospiraceae bacterium]MBR3516132.1 4Fe-4S binding protein [Lachnospiraceae bacterium]MBR6156892.1 4Fe-4S binding protein [Lachnospiraceae bacterium]
MANDYATLKKGGFMKQRQKDRFSLRLSIVGGQVSAEQLAVITEVAKQYGHGYVHLTSRQSIEIPYIKLEDVDKVKDALAEGGVAPGVCGPRVRTITACQGDAVCPNGCIETEELAKELNERYFGQELPHKFKFGVTGCQNNCLKAEENDIGIKGGVRVSWIKEKCINCGVCKKVCREGAVSIGDGVISIERDKCNFCGRCALSCPTDAYDTVPGYLISFGGLFGNQINKGELIVPFIEDKETLFAVCDAALNFFRENANPSERFKFTIDRVGKEKLDEIVWKAYRKED